MSLQTKKNLVFSQGKTYIYLFIFDKLRYLFFDKLEFFT